MIIISTGGTLNDKNCIRFFYFFKEKIFMDFGYGKPEFRNRNTIYLSSDSLDKKYLHKTYLK